MSEERGFGCEVWSLFGPINGLWKGNERAYGRGLGDEPMKGADGRIRRNLRMFDWAMAGRMRKDKNKWVISAIIFGTGSILQ